MSSVYVHSIYLSAGQWLFQDWLAVGIVTHLIAQISLKLMSPLNTFALTRKQFLTFFKLVRNCYAIKNKKCPDENYLLYVVFIGALDVLCMVFLCVIIKVINLKWQNGYDMWVEEIMKLNNMVPFSIYWHWSYWLCEVADKGFEFHFMAMFHQVHRTVACVPCGYRSMLVSIITVLVQPWNIRWLCLVCRPS